MLLEFSGTALEVEKQIERVKEISKQNNCNQFKFAVDKEERDSLWLARKVALWSSKALRPGADLWITGLLPSLSLPPISNNSLFVCVYVRVVDFFFFSLDFF